ncbi:unnamed protein product [Chondrus crispus]|uniref:Pesticidal crystal protein domain-containing protein n=1 Tax=Chondrus crispus TaxID=2769 RepID=R7QDF3_CHOCR|nr:unnamed protein product [Chondrus crispus]CDF36527.1 unnamed protein product [Chondrus crispus]|eukprot:XP_005716346.1 unnamed protein product [Chondrus crispus]
MRGNILASFLEIDRTVEALTIQKDDEPITVVFDFLSRTIRSRSEYNERETTRKFGILAIAEPLGVVLEKIRVVREDDFGDDEELYGRFHTFVSGVNVPTQNSRERELYDIEKPIHVKEGDVHEVVDATVLIYGVDRSHEIFVAGWLKERDITRDDDLGFHQISVAVERLDHGPVVLSFRKSETDVEVHVRIIRNYFEYVSREDGFVPLNTGDGVHHVPRFAGVVPMPHNRVKGIVGGVNILPEGPESVSNRLRSVVLLGIGIVPHVGDVVSGVIDLLWPEEEMEVWDEIKERAEALMKNLITKERVHDIEKRLRGLKQTIDDYQNTSIGSPEKGSWMVNVISSLNAVQPFFLDDRNPEVMLPYLVALATLTLAVRREQIVSYKEIHGRDDRNADYKLREIRGQYEEFHDAVVRARKGATEWRLNLVEIQEDEDKDKFVVSDEFSGYVSDKYKDHPGMLYENIKECVQNDFRRRLDDITLPAKTWKYMIPDAKKRKIVRKETLSVSGLFPVAEWSGEEGSVDGMRISKIVFVVDDYVRGVEVWHGESLGLRCGDMSRGEEMRLELDSDEVIIAASGRGEKVMHGMWVFTSKGRAFGASGKKVGGYEWTAAAPSLDGYLESVFVEKGGIGFRWRHWMDE